MSYLFGALIFWCGVFVGAIIVGLFICAKRDDDYPHENL